MQPKSSFLSVLAYNAFAKKIQKDKILIWAVLK